MPYLSESSAKPAHAPRLTVDPETRPQVFQPLAEFSMAPLDRAT